MKRIIVLFLISVTVFSNLSGCASKAQWTDKTSLSDEERVSRLKRNDRASTISFEEIFESADLVVTVKIKEFRGYYVEKWFTPSSVFEAEIVEIHRNNVGYTAENLYLLQYGTPEQTVVGYPLFKIGDVFLLGLTRSDKNRYSSRDYDCTFDIVNTLYGLVQIFEYEGVSYAMNRAIPGIFSEGATKVTEETFETLRSAFYEYDPLLESGLLLEAYRYGDVLRYMEELKT